MLKAPIPDNDKERLASLYALNLLDSEPEERFDRLSRLSAALFDVPIAYLSVIDENRQWYLSCFGMPTGETGRSVSFCGHAIMGEEALVIPDAAADFRFQDNPLVTGPPNIRFYAGQPLRAPDGQKVGTLCLADHAPRSEFGAIQRERLVEMGQLAERELATGEIARLHTELAALREKERDYMRSVDEMLKLGSRIQTDFLPRNVPEIDGWEVCARFRPAMEVSGDFYDTFTLEDGRVAVVIGDVAGKGVGAAMYMALNRTLLRAFVEQAVRDGARVKAAVPALNDYLIRHHDSRGRLFSSLFFGILDTSTGELGYVNAGHPAPWIIGPDSVEQLKPTGPAVGLSGAAQFRLEEAVIPPDGLLIGFTDGVTEARSAGGDEFGDMELAVLLRGLVGRSAADAVDALCDAADSFCDGKLADDLTVVAVSRCVV
jgi:phosphoserine phosphatase RsbU/P